MIGHFAKDNFFTNTLNTYLITMAILNGIISRMKGSAGDLVFKQVGDQTIVCEKPTKMTNPRTDAQMKQRTKWGNIIAMYKGIKPLINYGFENKPSNNSDYNMFVKLNTQKTPVYLTKQQIAGGACIATNYQITQGSLPAIGATTTVAQFAQAVVENNSDYKYGDQISYFLVRQQVNTDTNIPYCQFSACKVVLDPADTNTKLWDIAFRNGFSASDACLAHSGNDGDCAFCWVHSRKSEGKTLVSSQGRIVENSKLADYQGDMAYSLARSSYGESRETFLSPDGNVGSTESTTPSGGGNGGGGNDSL